MLSHEPHPQRARLFAGHHTWCGCSDFEHEIWIRGAVLGNLHGP